LPEDGGLLAVDVTENLFSRNVAEQKHAEIREINRPFRPHNPGVETLERRIRHKVGPKPFEIQDNELFLH
jgi:hypothetical protein